MLLELSSSPETLNTTFILGEIIYNVNAFGDLHPNIDVDLLRQLAEGIEQDQMDSEDAVRAICQAFQTTPNFDEALARLESDTRTKVSAFVGGKSAADVTEHGFDPNPALLHHLSYDAAGQNKEKPKVHVHASPAHSLLAKAKAKLQHQLIIYEDIEETMVMEAYSDVPFVNWGLNVNNRPAITVVPTTVLGLQNLVKTFKGRRIRCNGYRHGRAEVFADDGDILVSFLPLREVSSMPEADALFPDLKPDAVCEFATIQVFRAEAESSGTMRVRVGSAVTAEELRRWAVKDGWALHNNVATGHITQGGIAGTIMRGTGFAHRTINDQITSIDYVDANGQLQTISDPLELRAAAGCFGLLGIITHITYEVHKMTYAVMQPRKLPTLLAIPPVDRATVPKGLNFDATDEQLAAAIAEFERRAEKDDYAAWCWFTYQSDVYVNTWSSTSDGSDAVQYAMPDQAFMQWLAGWIAGVMVGTDFFTDLPARWQAQLLATTASAVLPPMTSDDQDLTIKAAVPDAQHFRRDHPYIRERNMELEIPIPALSSDSSKPDWSAVRKAWWKVIGLVHSSGASPLRLTVELRIMGDSKLIMAPQSGNTHGTAAIQITTLPYLVPDAEWAGFRQRFSDAMISLAPAGGVRPHWGKDWSSLRMGGLDAPQYLRQVCYKAKITEFQEVLTSIGKRQGWTLKDLQNQFSNKLWDEIIFGVQV